MALDRDKVARNALKFIQKGQFQKAIDEYKRVLVADPRDIRTRLKLIDLYSRAGQTKEAIEHCLQVTEVYAEQGFYLKAIAVYKQALRVDPENPALCRSMGEMYLKQGLVGDALGSFKRAVDLLRQQDRQTEAEELLLRMEEMAPENAAIKVHLSELYLSEGKYEAFEQEVSKLILQLRGEGRSRKLLQAVESFYERSNHHPSVLTKLAELYVDLGEEEKALAVIGEGLAPDPADRSLRLLALRANLLLGRLVEARRIALDLHEEEPDDLFILEQIASIAQARGEKSELADAQKMMAKVYGRRGLQQKEEECYRRVLELYPDDAEAQISLGGVRVDPPARAPKSAGRTPAGRQVVLREVGPDRERIREGLVEAELYLKYGMEEKAAEKLGDLVRISPRDLVIRQQLRDLYQRKGDRKSWIAEQLQIAELFLREKRENEALRAYQAILEVDSSNNEARRGVQYLKPDTGLQPAQSIEIDLDGSAVEVVEVEAFDHAAQKPIELEQTDRTLSSTLEEADFYEAQGLPGEAVKVLLSAREKRHDSPEIVSRLERLGHGHQQLEASPDVPFVDLQREILDAADPALARDLEEQHDLEISEFDDIVREFKSGIAEKVEESDYDTHYNLGVAYREMELLEDAAQEFQLAARSSDKARDAYTSLALVFRDLSKYEDAQAALRMALAAPTNNGQDRAAILYEMGAIAEEQSDWTRALRFFEKAYEECPTERGVQDRIRKLRARNTE